MPLSLFFGSGRNPTELGAMVLDVTLQEVHQRAAEITDHPIEGGGQVQDHVTNLPRRLSLQGMITATPLMILSPEDPGRVQSAFDQLEALYDNRQPFQVVTGYRAYDNMVFESLDMPRTREGAIRFRATLKQLQVVRTEVARLPEEAAADAADVAAGERDAGRQQTREATEAEEQRGSALYEFTVGGGAGDLLEGIF